MTPSLPAVLRAGSRTVGELLTAQARQSPFSVALIDHDRKLDFKTLNMRVNRLAHGLTACGVTRGTRIAILSENRVEYIEATYAAAKLGAILAALNWRLAKDELQHCISLVEPCLILVSQRFEERLDICGWAGPTINIDREYEGLLGKASSEEPPIVAQPEDGLLILYTSGTTGFPKGALISHRAELARLDLSRIDVGLAAGDAFIAWAPMFHMVSLEHALHTHALGGKVFILDGPEPKLFVDYIESDPQWWVVVLPGMIDEIIQELKVRKACPRGVKRVGVLADLLPKKTVAEISALLNAPYWNSFGSTETGMAPAAGTVFAPGEEPETLAKAHNSLYLWRLVDDADRDVAPGEPGEIAVRGPTVFSGYWNALETTAKEFRNGYFHMGDMFVELSDGRLNYVDRAKYLIKSGGENIYPLEIERILMADPSVIEAVVVKKRDDKWGEVPVAFVVTKEDHVSPEYLIEICRSKLADYKVPRDIRFVNSTDDFPRSTSGKVQRQRVEAWVK